VVGEDDELQAGRRGRPRDILGRAAAVGERRVDVDDADRAGTGGASPRPRTAAKAPSGREKARDERQAQESPGVASGPPSQDES
jgi:hypothetical protein